MSASLSILIVNYNERQYLEAILRQLRTEFSSPSPEVIVVDNNSHDGSAEAVRRTFPEVQLIASPTNLFYGQGNSLAMQHATGDWLMILNPDVTWEKGTIARLAAWAASHPGVDVVAPRLCYDDGRTQHSAHQRFPSPWTVFVDYCLPLQQILMVTGRHPYQLSARAHEKTQSIAHATGACLLVRREVVREIGGFDPAFTIYLEETDWQARMRAAGYRVWLYADATVTHFGSAQKSFAQASPHYLWGLRWFATKHWSSWQRRALEPAVYSATIISTIFLGVVFIPSFALGAKGRRLRYYFNVYQRLLWRLPGWPKQRPN